MTAANLLRAGCFLAALLYALPGQAQTSTPVTYSTNQTVSSQIIGTGTVTITNGATVGLTNTTNSYSGGTIVQDSSTLAVGSDTVMGNDSGTLSLNTATLDTTSSTGAVTSTRNFNIGGTGTIITGSGGTWTLNGAVSGGTLNVTGNGGELILGNTGNSFGALNVYGGSSVQAATNTDLSGGPISLGDASDTTYGGTLDLSTATAAVTASNNIVLNEGGGTILTGSGGTWTWSGTISGTGNLNVTGSGGTLILSAGNTYTGNTLVYGGATLQISSDSNLGADSTLGGAIPGSITLGNASTGGTLSVTGGGTSVRKLYLDTGGGTIDTGSGVTWTFTNPVQNVTGDTGSLTVGGSGVLVLDGANTYTGATTVSSGTLMIGSSAYPNASVTSDVTVDSGGTLSGYGTITGTLSNSGNVSPGGSGSPGTLTVTSNYTAAAGSTTTINVFPSSSSTSPILNVGGVASFASGTTLNVVYSGNFHNQTIDLIGATGGITGYNNLTLNYASPSTSLGASISEVGGDEIVLTLSELAFTQDPTIFSNITTQAIDEAQADNDMVLNRLIDARSEAVTDEMLMADAMYHRAGGSSGQSPYGAWMKALGGTGSTSGAGAYNSQGEGFIAGIDTEISPGAAVGVAVSYGHSSITQNDGSSGKINTPRLILYGGWWRGPIALDGSLGYGDASLSSSRPTTGGTATSSYTGSELTAAFQASSPQRIGSFALTPAVGVDYARLNQTIANESGGGTYNVASLPGTTNSMRPFIAATVATRFGLGYVTKIEPQFRLAYEYEALGISRAAQIEPEGDAAVYEISGSTPSRGIVNASAGIKVETSRSLAFFANVDAMSSGDSNSFGGDAGMRWRF